MINSISVVTEPDVIKHYQTDFILKLDGIGVVMDVLPETGAFSTATMTRQTARSLATALMIIVGDS